jgi:hypothetical protein
VGLRDIRGYDAVDPGRFIELLRVASEAPFADVPYAITQWMRPKGTITEKGLHLSPVLDMLNVAYVICRGTPLPEVRPAFQSPDYWVMTNASVLPRAFVPRTVEAVPDARRRLERLGAPDFDPRQVAFVEQPLAFPSPCVGTADILGDEPNRVRLAVRMQTAGLVVVSDLWDPGWRAWLNGTPVPVLRANHAVRGVVVPEGSSTLEFRYQPASFARGVRCCVGASLVLCGWFAIALWRRPTASSPSPVT